MNRAALRALFGPHSLWGALPVGAALTALGLGLTGGGRWLLLLGAAATAGALFLLAAVAEAGNGGASAAPRPGRPTSYAPAHVHGVRVVHAGSGRTLRDSDGQAQGTLFVFDLTVVPAGRAPYRVLVRHPLDVQGLAGQGKDGTPVTAVAAYEPEEPWRTVLPASPPPRERQRARALAAAPVPTASPVTRVGLPAGASLLVLGVLYAGAVVALVRAAG
ncbi:hypothetical protein [Streptomyces fungicidicus]|uniref:Uncharacterized protein n=1 Tax=Streptomyces fungicidicus TaxID=68203 RepID=A0ACC7Y2G0_9ACTN|nr:hypothetical protein [Streptomyces fungicidicus]NUV76007.1 hypothetical protein [Streptomyces fungicidicus]